MQSIPVESSRAVSRRDVLQAGVTVAGGVALSSCAHRSAAATTPVARQRLLGGLEVRGTRFVKDGKPFFVSGINYWAGTTLARDAAGWDRVRRDLDGIQTAGINVVRTVGATEGPDTEPLRIVPTVHPVAGRFDVAGVAGVLRFAEELKMRGLYGIFMLSNFWPWSGGMAQLLAWAGEGPIPYPPPHPAGSWDRFQRFVGNFYKNEKARAIYEAYVRYLVPQLASNPSVIWELANEPRGMTSIAAYRQWIDASARLIKSLAPGQLVTTGSEGQTDSPMYAGMDVVRDHESAAIDFICFHMWAQNWGWVRKDNLPKTFPRALERAKKYVETHAALAAEAGKPILLEEFGFPRDGGSCDLAAPTTFRDRYFEEVYRLVASLMATTPMAGLMPWAWSGTTKPPRPGQLWKPGDPFVGDPPHEEQGWYSIYADDPTLKLISAWSPRIVGAAITA